MSFREEPLQVKIYVSLVVSAAALFLWYNPFAVTLIGWPFLFFVLLNMAFENLGVELPRGYGSVSVGFAVSLALIILMGPVAAVWANAFNIVHFNSLKQIRKMSYRLLFNTAQLMLSAGLAGYTYVFSGGTPGSFILPANILPLIASTFTYFFVNAVLVIYVMSLSKKVSFFGMWLTNFRWSAPNYFAVAPLGVLIAVVYTSMGMSGVLLLVLPLLLARHTFILYMDMRNQYLSTIRALTKAIDAKDHYTHGHSERVARYVVMIGQEMALPEDFLEKLEYLALMHDIGKIGIPESILNKPSRLSDEEFNLVRGHSAVGADIISNIKFIGEYADIVRHHHERVDGSGYPDGLTGDLMSVGAKIVSAADAFDAMTSLRTYREPMTKQEAVAELKRCSDTQFCPVVVDAFIKVLRRKGEIK
ncbi:MAG: HD-GYP domain-containing protein [Dethiobacter sp.]|jgi:HD-GYP domain-containing protein (c-di-GMP phosphodiesterase class II)|nr:HD-GYP domain-containing protein [Dethiobacter sp.]